MIYSIRDLQNLSWLFLSLMAFGTQTFGQAAFKPILPLDLTKVKQIPFLEEGYRDLSLVPLKTMGEAEILSKQSQDIATQYRALTGVERGTQAKLLMQNYVRIAYFLEDQLFGKLKTNFKPEQLERDLEIQREKIANLGEEYEGIVEDQGEKSYGRFHNYINRILLGKDIGLNSGRMENLLKTGKLPKDLERPVKFYLAVNAMNGRQEAGATNMNQLLRTVPEGASVAGQLAMVKYYAGLDAAGKKVAKTNDTYAQNLRGATERVGNLAEKQKNDVLGFAIALWRVAVGPGASWENPPISFSHFKTNPELAAISEREALSSWSKGNERQAVVQYVDLYKKNKSPRYEVRLQQRILVMEDRIYKKTKDLKAFERAILEAKEDYRKILAEKGVNKKRAERISKAIASIDGRHKTLVNENIAIGMQEGTKPELRREVIAFAGRYIKGMENASEVERIEVAIARLHVLNGDHKEAVAIYERLANNSKGESRRKFLMEAVRSQHILAKWPNKAPWDGITKEVPSERQVLIKLYEGIHQLNGTKVDWNIASHTGLLLIDQNEAGKAFSFWEKALRLAPNHSDSNLVTGILLTTYLNGKKWDNLEEISRFVRSARLKPIHGNTPLDAGALLTMSLYEGGIVALKARQYRQAALKFKELISKHKTEYREHTLLLLAQSFRGLSDHKNSIDTLLQLAQEFPAGTHTRSALINGGDWSIDLAFEENSMLFYEQFIATFPNDQEIDRISDTLAKIYLGRRLYNEAVKILEKRFVSLPIPPNRKLDSALEWMMVEERFGERESALKVSNLILQTNVTPQVRSQALAARARYMASKRNLRELQKIELELKSLPADSIIKEHHGEVLFLIAETQIRPFLQSVNSHRVQDPLQSIFDRYDLFMKTSKDYIAVCDGIVTSFCLASYYRIGRLGERLAELIRDFRIPATYDDKVINQFIVKKEALEDKLNGQIADANKKVNSLLNSGYSLPEWNQLAIWHVRGETNFSSINGELAKAYVQWDMDKKE